MARKDKIRRTRLLDDSQGLPAWSRRATLRSPLLMDQLLDQAQDAWARAIAACGGSRELAKVLGISQIALKYLCPPWACCRVAAATGWDVTPHELRPDIFPYPEDGVPRALRGWVLRRSVVRSTALFAPLTEHHMQVIEPPPDGLVPGTSGHLDVLALREDLLLVV